ncbi:hypothetical protein FA15DRAFT_649933 [Coprinopsis marcescibilis]|uniref:MYND-type domain-containing protein n=1 Tax=Coprinopsis marcescibilis TaxID=230819 RepID=A0A5C3KED6_COPMA|nr:hypothetical protein FA15DRAFT_649933 [Coprinopsis marcescibilis]
MATSLPPRKGELDSIDPDEIRTVHLPLQKLDKCAICSKKEGLRLCSACGEKVYCSPECQKGDWKQHKPECGKTDRICIQSFYPLLALLMEASRLHPERPRHPAQMHKIVNSPNPSNSCVCKFPDGTSANLILLGDPCSEELFMLNPAQWWPTAETPRIRNKLAQRFVAENYLLPAVVAVSFALLAEIYTTTADANGNRRIRLQYKSSPIADFGIARGSVDVKSQDRFAYYNVADESFMFGQDPNDHYWIYFTTIRGEEILLECGMFVFNMCLMVTNLGPYLKHGLPPITTVPAHLVAREHRQVSVRLHYEKERFSVLRDPELQEAVRYSRRFIPSAHTAKICRFMEKVAGRPHTSIEKKLVMLWAIDDCEVMSMNLVSREYLNFPATPVIGVFEDPGEMDDPPQENEAWHKYVMGWSKKYKRGQITTEQLHAAFRAWSDASHEVRMQMSARGATKSNKKNKQGGGSRGKI